MANIIDGKAIALKIRDELKREVDNLKKVKNLTPGLSVILVGEDPSSTIYVRNKQKACEETGIRGIQHVFAMDTREEKILSLIDKLNNDASIHGILVQLPLPKGFNQEKILEAVSPMKDVDGFHPFNVGRLSLGKPVFEPCTPRGILKLIDSTGVDMEGMDAAVLGRSNIVGKPTALMLLKRNATVCVCHSKTKNLPEIVASVDIVVAAMGKGEFVKGEWLKPGAIVIDVGINRSPDGKIVGDVEFSSASKIAGYITPVPGGVGPMTVAMLLENTVKAAKQA